MYCTTVTELNGAVSRPVNIPPRSRHSPNPSEDDSDVERESPVHARLQRRVTTGQLLVERPQSEHARGRYGKGPSPGRVANNDRGAKYTLVYYLVLYGVQKG